MCTAFVALALERAGWMPCGRRTQRRARTARARRCGCWLELTYRCPLHCVFCYNPTDFARTGPELDTADWLRVLREARALGAVQLGLSGGEPLLRDDLEPIVAEAHALGYYINLITSGVGLNEARIARVQAAPDSITSSSRSRTPRAR